MAGKRLPIVFAPRYTTYAGSGDFPSVGIDVSPFDTIVLNVWRGVIVGGGSFNFKLQRSTDQTEWTTCAGWPFAPGEGAESQLETSINDRYLRLVAVQDSMAQVTTCYAFGYFVRRVR